ncbi:MAG: copper chaperone PCu(A)C [Gemmatimonadales bacterium]
MTARVLLLLVLTACAAEGPPIEVRDAYSYESVLGNVGVVYFTIENRGAQPDTLVDVEVSGALVAMVHEQVAQGAMVEMRHVGPLPIPPDSTVVLRPGGLHVMMEGLDQAPVAGDTLTVTVRFARGQEVVVLAPVIPYGAEP